LVAHLESHVPWNAEIEIQRTKEAPPFRCETDGPGYAAARRALEAAYGKPVGEAGSGGSIPLLRTLQKAAPNAEFILWGPEDVAAARIHASDESVDPTEIEKMAVAQALLLQDLADTAG
jgi:acetylornithine deacetylase/succinyl-diaminopimelate desuccinylase-like protein